MSFTMIASTQSTNVAFTPPVPAVYTWEYKRAPKVRVVDLKLVSMCLTLQPKTEKLDMRKSHVLFVNNPEGLSVVIKSTQGNQSVSR